MSDLVKRSDVIETANKFSFTDEHEKRRYLDFLDYCLKETKTAYNVDAAVEEMQDSTVEFELFGICSEYIPKHIAINAVRKGGVNENNN